MSRTISEATTTDEEKDAKRMCKERKAGRSRAEKALGAVKTQSAPATPARADLDALQGKTRSSLPLSVSVFFLPLPNIPKEEKREISQKGRKCVL